MPRTREEYPRRIFHLRVDEETYWQVRRAAQAADVSMTKWCLNAVEAALTNQRKEGDNA